MTETTEPRTQDLPASINIPEGGFSSGLFNDLLRSVKVKHRRDPRVLRFVVSKATEEKYREALRKRGIEGTLENLSYGPSRVEVDETLTDDVILLERRGDADVADTTRVRRVEAGELSVKAKPVRIPPRATFNEVKGMAEHSKVQNETRKRVQFGAERNILGSHIEVLFDGARLGTVFSFQATRELGSLHRKTRPGGSGKLTLPGSGWLGLEKVNSSWPLFFEEQADLSKLTLRVTISDPGMPNPETTEYTGVKIERMGELVSLGDIVQQAVEFTFLDSEVIRPVEEPANDKMYELWEYRWSDGQCREKPDSLIPA